MRFSSVVTGILSSLLFATAARAAPTCNTPSNRACWSNGFTIYTDYEASTPLTGKTVTYTLTLTEVDNWVGPDGVAKEKAMLINGGFPGPTLRADWGDRITVTVINKLRTNGTSFHWHGIRQLNSATQDGANGVTECPIPPNGQKTYSFLATQYGSSWYHSHTSAQYANGVIGTIDINGPAALPYDIDLGVFPIADWYYGTADNIVHRVTDPNNPFVPFAPGAPPPSDNVLINGTNINPSGPGGKYAKVTLTPGKRHLLKIIGTSVENNYQISLVGHQFTVIGVDFVPVNAYTTSSLFVGVGQRYIVTIDGSAKVDNYWFNVTFSQTGACGSSKNPFPAAVFSYVGAPDALPKTPGSPPVDSLCADNTNFSPVVQRQAPITNFNPTANNLPVTFEVHPEISKVFWKVNGTAIDVAWDRPTLQYVLEHNTSYPTEANIIKIPTSNIWTVWLIQNVSPIPHPMHLHGHDFVILGRSPALAAPFAPTSAPRFFNPATDTATFSTYNPTRRDVTMLPAFGWLAVAFKTDNPGAWLFHCHIAWHVSQGLSVQFLERVQDIPNVMNLGDLTQNCNAWRSYYPTDPFQKADSGI